MSARPISEAFEVYLALGATRSYRAVAAHFGVPRHVIAQQAAREHWQQRLDLHERESREALCAAFVERETQRLTRPIIEHAERARRRLEVVGQYKPRSFDDALDIVMIAAHMIRLAERGRADEGEGLVDLLLVRMCRRGDISRQELIALLDSQGGAR